MQRYLFMIALALASVGVQAKGVPFAVPTLDEAQQTARKDDSKHVLVFYTSEN